jgi:transcriptional regulator GlxA family with amidase domain
MHRLTVLALPDVVAFDLATPAQVFGNEPGRYGFTACGLRAGQVPTTTGFAIQVANGLEALAQADTVLVPGLRPAQWPPPAEVLDALRTAHARGARVASICTGAFVLAHAGLLDGRRATTHWAYADRLAERYPAVTVDPGVLYVDEGAVLTSAGVAAGIDLCLHLVRRDHGAEAANAVARRIVVAPHRDGGQAQFVDTPLPALGERGLAPTRTWALRRLSEPLTVAAMARHAALQRSHLRAPLPRRDRHHPVAVAAVAAGPPRAAAARGDRPPDRGRRRSRGLRDCRLAAVAFPPCHGDDAGRVSP